MAPAAVNAKITSARLPRSNRTLLVANPTAKSGKAKRYIDEALAVLEDTDLEPEFLPTLPAGATVEALATRLEQEDVARVVYMGGDGTFAEAAKGIILARERAGIDVPLGMLPMGTANDQGRSFGIVAGVRALRQNVEIIAAGVEMWLDVGRIEAIDGEGKSFRQDLWFDSCGVGLSARILAQRNREREWVEKVPLLRRIYRDKVVYTSTTLRMLLRGTIIRKDFACEIVVDDATIPCESVTDILVQATPIYAGDWVFAPDGRPDDGKFEVIVLRGTADWAAAAIGGHKRNPVTGDDLEVMGLPRRVVPSGAVIEIKLAPANGKRRHVPAQIDGEEFPAADHYRIENLFHHLRIIVPEGAHWV